MIRKAFVILALSTLTAVAYIESALAANARDPSATGDALLETCNDFLKQQQGHRASPAESINAHSCLMYVTGIRDAISMMEVITHRTGSPTRFMACMPEGMTNGQVIALVSNFFKNQPRFLDKPPIGGVILSLRQEYPCTFPDDDAPDELYRPVNSAVKSLSYCAALFATTGAMLGLADEQATESFYDSYGLRAFKYARLLSTDDSYERIVSDYSEDFERDLANQEYELMDDVDSCISVVDGASDLLDTPLPRK